MKIAILIPVYNDWVPLAKLLPCMNKILQDRIKQFRLILVDDASEEPAPSSLLKAPNVFSERKLLRLQCNLGYPRAIAVGLTWLYHHGLPDAVVIMDGAGEDKPEDIPRFLDKFIENGRAKAVFA
jgi:polyisoprenyl-phosphate glycosyltransferase